MNVWYCTCITDTRYAFLCDVCYYSRYVGCWCWILFDVQQASLKVIIVRFLRPFTSFTMMTRDFIFNFLEIDFLQVKESVATPPLLLQNILYSMHPIQQITGTTVLWIPVYGNASVWMWYSKAKWRLPYPNVAFIFQYILPSNMKSDARNIQHTLLIYLKQRSHYTQVQLYWCALHTTLITDFILQPIKSNLIQGSNSNLIQGTQRICR